ncbi:MAG: creatininase family protein [Candidatus Omnitrophica bacterium]|nr:creatininase family protein [Candidatus Omnitrophota bacterium]MCM8827735.1 creatininase family protein [Candidatus Omnitrophota bacterium]
MRYELMFPEQIRKATKENWPVVLPVGVLEYHSEHCAVGVDTLLIVKALEVLEREIDLIILPPFYYGAASYAVEPPENNGTIHIDSSVIHIFARHLFKGLIRVGFRNIHIFVHHQSENFVAGMPTDLAFKLAAREVIFEFLEKEKGEGWWGDNRMQDYYRKLNREADPFNWIKIHPFMDEKSQEKFPIDHAGMQETSLMLAFCPEGVDKRKISTKKWYARKSSKANLNYGNEAKKMILERMREVLNEK